MTPPASPPASPPAQPSDRPSAPSPTATQPSDTSPPRRTTRWNLRDWRLKFVVLGVIWGFSFFFIKIGTEGFAPLQVTVGRVTFGSVVLLAALLLRGESLPRGLGTWGHLAVTSILISALPFSLFAYAELHISSTLAGICNATTPLFGLLVALVALRDERPTRRRVTGMVLGFAGVMVVLGAWQGFAGVHAGGTSMALLASSCYAVGWAYVRRFLSGRGLSSLSMTSAQLLIAAGLLTVAVLLLTEPPTRFPVDSSLSVLCLGAVGTGLALLLQHSLVRDAGATIGTMVTYLMPIVATAAGVLLLDERLTWNLPVGAAVILVGAALAQHRRG